MHKGLSGSGLGQDSCGFLNAIPEISWRCSAFSFPLHEEPRAAPSWMTLMSLDRASPWTGADAALEGCKEQPAQKAEAFPA